MTEPHHGTEGAGTSQGHGPLMISSPSDLLDHLIRATDSVEKAWSKGMDNEEVAVARREAKELWSAFTISVTERMDRISRLDQRFGLDTLSEGFPLDEPVFQVSSWIHPGTVKTVSSF